MAEWEAAVEAHLHNTRDILATKTSEQHWNATICAVAIRLSTEGSGDVGDTLRALATGSKGVGYYYANDGGCFKRRRPCAVEIMSRRYGGEGSI